MRKILLFTTLLFSGLFGFAQNNTNTATLEYNGAKYPCETIEYNIPPGDMETIIKDKMRASGYNPEKGKSFLVYRSVKLNDLDAGQPHDLIFKVDNKSRKEKGISIVYLVTARPGEIPAEKVKGSKGVALVSPSAGAASLLESYQAAVAQQAHNLAVLDQADAIAKAQNKLAKMRKEQSKLEKKIKDYQSDLAANQKSQEKQVAEIEAMKKAMEELKSKQP